MPRITLNDGEQRGSSLNSIDLSAVLPLPPSVVKRPHAASKTAELKLAERACIAARMPKSINYQSQPAQRASAATAATTAAAMTAVVIAPRPVFLR